MPLKILFLLALMPFIFSHTSLAQSTEEGYFILDPTGKWVRQFKVHEDLTIDHLSVGKGFELYGPKGLGQFLKNEKISFQPLPSIRPGILSSYPTPEEIEAELKTLQLTYPHLCKLYSIGNSVQNRPLWVMKISTNPELDDNKDPKPQFKYIANMHGDEIVGRELMMLFIKDLLQNYNSSPEIQLLLSNVQIHILVSMNPDGALAGRRGNAKGIDLNRNFPDFTTHDNDNSPFGRAPETQAVMHWQANHHFILSANFHGGAEVVNYPWDTTDNHHPQLGLVKSLSEDYAQNAPYIAASTSFPGGITNGYQWYEVNGGMQDWSSYWHDDLQLTVELSDNKWPSYERINYYYLQNKKSLFKLVNRARQ